MADRDAQPDNDELHAEEEDRTWLDEYGAAAVAIACGVASMAALAIGYARSWTAGAEFWRVMDTSIRVGTALAGLGTLAGIWALRRGRGIRGLTLCGGMLIACAVLWAWMLGYLHWI
jgi:hypothetical protein